MHRSIPLVLGTLSVAGAVVAVPVEAIAAVRTYRGQASTMQWGTVQVTIRVSGKRITAVSASYPTERPRSQMINTFAIPQLKREVLHAQSYRINLVSGATLTSDAFATSLLSALHAAHL